MVKQSSYIQSEMEQRVSEILFYVWDPIGINAIPACRDEYEDYVPVIAAYLLCSMPDSHVDALLIYIISECIGVRLTKPPRRKAQHLEAMRLMTEYRDDLLSSESDSGEFKKIFTIDCSFCDQIAWSKEQRQSALTTNSNNKTSNKISKLEIFKNTLAQSTMHAKDWFLEATVKNCRKVYQDIGKLGDNGRGSVYVYFKGSTALYVGETSRPIKRRMHDQEAPHKKSEWWRAWTSVRFLQVEDKTDRLTLELMLILALKPKYNNKPGLRSLNKMFGTSARAEIRRSKTAAMDIKSVSIKGQD